MPKFLIERTIPGVDTLTPEQLSEVAQNSNAALAKLGPRIQWIQSYVTADKMTCVYLAASIELIREHARIGEFPVDRISEIRAVVDPGSAEGALWLATPMSMLAEH